MYKHGQRYHLYYVYFRVYAGFVFLGFKISALKVLLIKGSMCRNTPLVSALQPTCPASTQQLLLLKKHDKTTLGVRVLAIDSENDPPHHALSCSPSDCLIPLRKKIELFMARTDKMVAYCATEKWRVYVVYTYWDAGYAADTATVFFSKQNDTPLNLGRRINGWHEQRLCPYQRGS